MLNSPGVQNWVSSLVRSYHCSVYPVSNFLWEVVFTGKLTESSLVWLSLADWCFLGTVT